MGKKEQAEALGVSRPTLDHYIQMGWVTEGRVREAMTELDPRLALVAPATSAGAIEIALNGTWSIRADKSRPVALRPGTLALVSPTSIEKHDVLDIEVLWQRSGKLAMPSTTGDDIAAAPSEWASRALEASLRADRLSSADPSRLVVYRLGVDRSTFKLTATVRRPYYLDADAVEDTLFRKGAHSAAHGRDADTRRVSGTA